MIPQCDHCTFYGLREAPDKSLIGVCKANPPTPIAIPITQTDAQGTSRHAVTIQSVFPPVDGKKDFCGLFEIADGEEESGEEDADA